MPNLLHWVPRELIRAGCSPTNSPGQPDSATWTGRDAPLRPGRRHRGCRCDRPTRPLGRGSHPNDRRSRRASNHVACLARRGGYLHTDGTGRLRRLWLLSPNWNLSLVERRAASRESRRARSLPVTKPPKLSPGRQEQLRRLAVTGEPVRELAAAFGIGRATAYRYPRGEVSDRFLPRRRLGQVGRDHVSGRDPRRPGVMRWAGSGRALCSRHRVIPSRATADG